MINMDNKKGSYSFRFQNLEIWKKAVEIGIELFDIADDFDKRHLYRFAEQLRASGLSMSNNIAEGSGSISKKEFRQFLNVARRSTFENANMIIIYQMRQLISMEQKEHLLGELDELCRMISGFVRALNS
jgi:four helix bundle protein